MDIINFQKLRVGSGFPNCFNIGVVSEHESYGIYASAYINPNKNENQILELRKNKHNQIAFFNYHSLEQELPTSWKDSEILWKNY